jgi:hypothetical protein
MNYGNVVQKPVARISIPDKVKHRTAYWSGVGEVELQITQLKDENPLHVCVTRAANCVEVRINKCLSSAPRSANSEFLSISQLLLGFSFSNFLSKKLAV